jgi:hypothetical protein
VAEKTLTPWIGFFRIFETFVTFVHLFEQGDMYPESFIMVISNGGTT